MRRNSGSILIFTLWILIIVSVLSIILSRRAGTDVNLARHESKNIKATYLAKAGIMKMLAELAKDTEAYKGEPKELTIRNDRILYGASDENSRLNLNSPVLKKEYLDNLGIEDTIAENILQYRSKKTFEFMEELFLVEDVTPEVYSALQDVATIYVGSDARLNINTAGREVLYAIIEDWAVVDDIMEKRKGEDGEEGTEDDGIKAVSEIEGLEDPTLFSVSSDIFRIWSKAFLSVDEEALVTAEAVVDIKKGTIFYWKEE